MELSVPDRTISFRASTGSTKRWFSRPRFVRSRSAGSPFLVMHTWCQPSWLEYGSRALSRLANQPRAELFFQFSIFARETRLQVSCSSSCSFCYVCYECRVSPRCVCDVQGSEDQKNASSLYVTFCKLATTYFCKRTVQIVAILRKVTYKCKHSMSLCHHI